MDWEERHLVWYLYAQSYTLLSCSNKVFIPGSPWDSNLIGLGWAYRNQYFLKSSLGVSVEQSRLKTTILHILRGISTLWLMELVGGLCPGWALWEKAIGSQTHLPKDRRQGRFLEAQLRCSTLVWFSNCSSVGCLSRHLTGALSGFSWEPQRLSSISLPLPAF